LITLCFSDRGDFIRTISLVYVGMTAAMLIYLLFPNGQPLRPIVTDNDFFSWAVRYSIYANDTNTNCCPSIHVLNQLAIHIGICKSKLFRNRKGIKIASLIATILVCASTCFIKQHSVVDVILALLLEIPLYSLVFKVNWNRLVTNRFKVRKKRKILEQ
jgi:membrane-associated phospholipid phosphatase